MPVTLEQIGTLLEADEINFHHNKEKEFILFMTGNEKTSQSHFIRAKENGDIFEWQMQILDDNKDMVMIKDHQHAPLALSHMLSMNYSTKFGTWEYDPSDGDMRLAVEIPLEDALMTDKQFARISGFMVTNGQDGADAIRHILKTGEAPQDDSKAEMVAKIEAMLAQLKGDSSSDDGI